MYTRIALHFCDPSTFSLFFSKVNGENSKENAHFQFSILTQPTIFTKFYQTKNTFGDLNFISQKSQVSTK